MMKRLVRALYFLARAPFILLLRSSMPARTIADGKTVKKILVLRPDRIGDLVLTTPLLENLRKAYPAARIDLLVRPYLKELAECIDTVDRVILLGEAGLNRRLRDERYDICIDPVCDWRLYSAFLCFLTAAPVRCGFAQGSREMLFTYSVRPEDFPGQDMAELMLELLKAAGIPVRRIAPRLTVPKGQVPRPAQEEGQARASAQDSGRPRVVLHSGGYYPSQRWQTEKFIQLARMLLVTYGVDLVFIGSAQEKAGLGAIVSAVNDSHCRAFSGGLRELASLLFSSRVFIGNNSGPLHMAAALGVATVSLAGPTDPLFFPRGARDIVIRKNPGCSPCSRADCRRHRCMDLIEVDEVFFAVKSALEGKATPAVSRQAGLLDNVRSILVVNLGGIGDMVLCFPAIRALQAAYSRARVDALCVARVAPLAEGAGIFRNVYACASHPLFAPRLLFTLRSNRYDLAVNMRTLASLPGAMKMRLAFALINARVSAGRDTDGKGGFFSVRVPEKNPGEKYEMEYDLQTAYALGADINSVQVSLQLDPGAVAFVAALLEKSGIRPGELVVGVHPGGMPSRRWPADNFIEAMRSLAGRLRCRFVITGGAGETGLGKKLAEATGALDLTGKLDLKGTLALIARCGLFISNDTGPMHLAAALRVPLVAIFGPGQLQRFDPRQLTDKARILYKPSACAPCEKKHCADLKCLLSVAPDEVVSAACSLLFQEEIK
jgi:ADP-heptose:LPS heptosyltransferase